VWQSVPIGFDRPFSGRCTSLCQTHLLDGNLICLLLVCLAYSLTPENEVTHSSETSVNLYQTIRRHISILLQPYVIVHYKHDFWPALVLKI
jgi:hypothetical protein